MAKDRKTGKGVSGVAIAVPAGVLLGAALGVSVNEPGFGIGLGVAVGILAGGGYDAYRSGKE